MAISLIKSKQKVGKAIQKIRKKRGYSQEQLAEKVRISRTHMGHIEQARKSPSFDLLNKLASALGVRPKDLLP